MRFPEHRRQETGSINSLSIRTTQDEKAAKCTRCVCTRVYRGSHTPTRALTHPQALPPTHKHSHPPTRTPPTHKDCTHPQGPTHHMDPTHPQGPPTTSIPTHPQVPPTIDKDSYPPTSPLRHFLLRLWYTEAAHWPGQSPAAVFQSDSFCCHFQSRKSDGK